MENTPLPDPEGIVTWENLDSRIRANSLSAQILSESISGLEGIDYDLMMEDLRRQINDLARAQWAITMAGGDSSTLGQASDSLRDTFDDLKDGVIQADNADAVRQLQDTVNQLVAGGETLYITLLDLEQQAADGQRGLAALDRSLEELRLREQLGQVSRQSVAEVEQTRTETASQLQALDSSIRQMKRQLQSLLGESPTGELTLGALPAQEDVLWETPDYEADLAAAKAASWTLRAAEKELEDAREAWDDAQDDYRGPRKQYLYQQAEHTWAAAQLTWQSAVEDFASQFQAIYQSLEDNRRVLARSREELVWQQELLETARTKYQLGLISRSALLTAQDDAAAAQSAVDSAWRDLFAAQNRYRWAVECGLLLS